jgi:FixJ family two-component response regulator
MNRPRVEFGFRRSASEPRLPCARTHSRAPGEGMQKMDPPQVIFVVDDDASVRTAMRRQLLSLNLPVRLFASAEQFLAETDRSAHGCLILDLRLPGMSGLELQQRLVAEEWKLPIVIVTARDDETVRETTLRMGAIAYLRKPFDHEQFLACVRAAVVHVNEGSHATN